MTKKFVDCFILMSTALSLRSGQKLADLGRPLINNFTVTNVNLSLLVQEFHIIQAQHLELELTALLNQKWIDPRLGMNLRTTRTAVLGQIWNPKIFNINGELMNENNENTVFWRGYGDEGNVLLSEKIRFKTVCTKYYQKFPFDTQICEYKFGTYRFPVEEVAVFWDSQPLTVTTSLEFDQLFSIVNITTHLEVEVRCSGNFSAAVLRLILKRNPNYYIYSILSPTVLLSILNYVSFWLHKRCMRIQINLLVLGGMVYFYHLSIAFAPTTFNLKAVDLYSVISLFLAVFTFCGTVLLDNICTMQEQHFHSKKFTCLIVFWIELSMKLSYGIFYIFVILYCWLYT